MPGGLRNQPKIFRGAFVEYGLTIPPLVVVFQFNPLQLSRGRRQEFSMTAHTQGEEDGRGLTLRDFHQGFKDLLDLRDAQYVTTHPESLSFEIRLDATDKLNEGDGIAEKFGIAPQLATLELMAQPKNESVFGSPGRAATASWFQFHMYGKASDDPFHLGTQADLTGEYQQPDDHGNRVSHQP